MNLKPSKIRSFTSISLKRKKRDKREQERRYLCRADGDAEGGVEGGGDGGLGGIGGPKCNVTGAIDGVDAGAGDGAVHLEAGLELKHRAVGGDARHHHQRRCRRRRLVQRGVVFVVVDDGDGDRRSSGIRPAKPLGGR